MSRVRIVVELDVREDGSVSSRHQAASAEDVVVLSRMRFGGQDVVATALMGEAVRREAALLVGLVHATDPARISLMQSGDAKELGSASAQVLLVLESVGKATATKAVQDALSEIIGAVANQSV
jgi:hypothetical protein